MPVEGWSPTFKCMHKTTEHLDLKTQIPKLPVSNVGAVCVCVNKAAVSQRGIRELKQLLKD